MEAVLGEAEAVAGGGEDAGDSGQVGGPFDLSWHTTDGGGITFATGGVFELGGTLGQFDAHAPSVGGAFRMSGGFWAASALGPCNPADLAEPFGTLDFSDIIAFLTAFGAMDPAADIAVPFGVFDFSDVVAFLTAFGTGCP